MRVLEEGKDHDLRGSGLYRADNHIFKKVFAITLMPNERDL